MNLTLNEVKEVSMAMQGIRELESELNYLSFGDISLFDMNGDEVGLVRNGVDGIAFLPGQGSS